MNYDELYRKLDYMLRRLVVDLGKVISAEEQSAILHYVNVHEFGLALSTTTGILVEGDKRVSPSLIRVIRTLAEEMNLIDELPDDLDKYAQKPWQSR